MTRSIKILVAGFTLMLSSALFSQEKQAITLEDVLKIGGASNLTIKEYNELQNLALAENKNTKGWWLPEIYAGGRTHNLWGTAMNGDGRFFQDVSRESFWAGLGLNVVWNVGDGVYKAKAAGYRYEASIYLSQSKRNEALLNSIDLYYAALQSQLEKIAYQELAQQAELIAQQVKVKVDGGISYESDYLLAQSNCSYLKSKALAAEINYETNIANLQDVLGIPTNKELVCADTILTKLELTIQESSLEDAFQNRPEIKYLEFQKRSALNEKKAISTGLLFPEVQAGTSVGGFGVPFMPLSNQSVLNIGLVWKIPLSELGFGGVNKMHQSKINIAQIKIDQAHNKIRAEITSSEKEMQSAEKILELSEEAQAFSKKALDQSVERQKVGTSKMLEVFQMQQAYLKARLGFTRSVIRYNVAQYKQFVAKGNNL